jgi:hypothetical protein
VAPYIERSALRRQWNVVSNAVRAALWSKKSTREPLSTTLPNGESPVKTFLFVAGVARSGTTALMNVLASHGRIVLGDERFKFLITKDTIRDFGPRHFEKDPFFDFTDGFTNLTPDHAEHADFLTRFYARMEQKFDSALYVGDKVPSNFRFLDQLYEQFKPVRIIFIFRDVREVAWSWDERAANPADSWPSENNAYRAVERWNEAIFRFKDFDERHPGVVLPLEHSRFFGDHNGSGDELKRELDFLDLDTDDAIMTAYRDAAKRYRSKIIAKSRLLDPDLEKYIAEHAEVGTMMDICSSSP